MSLNITSRFKLSGSPQTGLSPTVSVIHINTKGSTFNYITDAVMTEVGDGLYKYKYDEFDPGIDYIFTFDAGADSDSRYLEAEWNGYNSLAGMIKPSVVGSDVGSSFSPDDLKSLLG